jgi:hypothetical protein
MQIPRAKNARWNDNVVTEWRRNNMPFSIGRSSGMPSFDPRTATSPAKILWILYAAPLNVLASLSTLCWGMFSTPFYRGLHWVRPG